MRLPLPLGVRLKQWDAARSYLLLAGGLLIATSAIWLNESYFLDDYVHCSNLSRGGYSFMVSDTWQRFGFYRPLTVPALTAIGAACPFPELIKFLGLTAHTAVGVFLGMLAHKALGLTKVAGILTAVIFVFNPLSLEAIAWPAAIRVYVLSASLLMGFAWRLVLRRRLDIWTVTLGVFAVMACEQTLLVVLIAPLVVLGWRAFIKLGFALTAYLVVVRLTTSHSYIQSVTPLNALENLDLVPTHLSAVAPGAPIWSEFFAMHPKPWHLLCMALIAAATMTVRQDGVVTDQWRAALVGLAAVIAFVVPFLLRGDDWWSPRMAYLPHLGVALVIGALVSSLRWRAASTVIGVVWVGLVIGGLSDEANAYVQTYRHDQLVASEIVASKPGQRIDLLILANSPWTVASNVPLRGEHIVHGFAPSWTPIAAVHILENVEIKRVLVDHGGDVLCMDNGVVATRSGAITPGSVTVMFDVASHRQFTAADATLPTCS